MHHPNPLVVLVSPSSNGLRTIGEQAALTQALRSAAQRWETAALECERQVKLPVAPAVPQRTSIQDGINLVVLRRDIWCHNERCGPMSTFSRGAAAITTTYPTAAVGARVVEADIELNAVHFEYDLEAEGRPLSTVGERPNVPLVPTLVHELGHLLGLQDACPAYLSGRPNVAKCDASERDSVMFAPGRQYIPTELDRARLCKVLAPHTEMGPSMARSQSPPDPVEPIALGLSVALGLLALFVPFHRAPANLRARTTSAHGVRPRP